MNKNEHVKHIISKLDELRVEDEALVHDSDIVAVKAVLDQVGYRYICRPVGTHYTKIEIRI